MTESKTGERAPVHYAMKTPSTTRSSGAPRSSHGRAHSRSNSHAKRSAHGSKASTPVASPRMPFSVGQAYPPPPRLSPGRIADARATSPNYFGLAPAESSNDGRDSSLLPRDNWSPPTSSVKSFTAALPRQVTIDANPDYEAFRRQADLNRGESFFNLSSSHFGAPSTPGDTGAAPARPRPPPRWHTHASDSISETPASRTTRERPASRMDVDQASAHDSAYVSSDSRPDVESSIQPPSILGMPRSESPRQSASPFERRTMLSSVEDRHPRLSIPNSRPDPPTPSVLGRSHQRAETLPADMEHGPSLISPSHLKSLLESQTRDTDLLLLDLRVSQQYLHARVKSALNLCTPTTLLKRATFNLTKLQQTFQNPEDKEQFTKWASTQNLVVYDSHSSEKRDAMSCVNMVKKFVAEGYQGGMFILRGGFKAFSEAYPDFVENGAPTGIDDGSGRLGNNSGGNAGILPVIGGVMLPNASNNPNPFFSNIRQNMDLADGVGQLEIARPKGLDSPSLPRWLRDASTIGDHGKQVSEKFLHIEKDEQSRMKKAYSVFNPESKSMGTIPVQLSGIEKGVKNRYKDILPFDHSRVKLQGRESGACDYVNASHIKASRSNKRYIAAQGPLPATYEDFWSVIWDQDIRVIVMLTAESEGGQLKCHPYWKGNEFGHTKLRLLSEKKVSLDIDKHRSGSHAQTTSQPSADIGRRRANTTTSTTSLEGATPAPASTSSSDSPYVIVRKFAMSHAAHPFAPIREITHLHYPSWPDFGAPAQPSHLLGLVELANVMQRAALPVDTPSVTGPRASPDPPMAWYDEPEADAQARPMLVHCSAGCGRTGTFCTVDSVIDMLKRQRLARTTLKPVRKRDSDGDIKMSGERQVEEAVSPKTAQEKAFNFATSPQRSSRSSPEGKPAWEGPSLNTAWVGDDTIDLIAETVEDFRSQRLSMVQSLRQG
ncbi:hypothetical protein D7B24_004445 [Verticillium nonalfalfae]|uniref:protein-tyrosine-phosphatase n=1 Tax=Verticillium nonalfalfae TaxID=1051616 RepID=A0A3M9YEK1_9PEZI|nr:uncharacterized protein D7B24_004445 [Verticillium nonalfalfae]RNJ58575.1 hypothetical protein D7B24_004445 [Verticillium nonalfalfae]